ncbi:MAG TPA: endonuclease III [Planctomycetota bacterium]|nr:endonuclease III [Planctomycetota bacterium]
MPRTLHRPPRARGARKRARRKGRKFDLDAARPRALAIARLLHEAHPGAACALRHGSPLQLLVATILSAQCTDARVNLVTPDLFARFRTAVDFANAPRGALERAIRSCGFYNAKAKSIRGACRRLVEAYGGEVPRTMEDLLTLPGVARKTANVVLGTAFGIPSGFVVDTHVHRLAQRLALTNQDTPEKIETDLTSLFPREEWIFCGHALIWHGRLVCQARKPACFRCTLRDRCPFEPKTKGPDGPELFASGG